MRRRQTRKVLQISTFLAVSLGLAMGTSVAAAPPADNAEPTEWAQADTDEPMVDEDEHVELREDIDFPGDIEDFAEFIQEHQEEGIEDVAEYTHEGAEHMADAMEEVIPGETGLFRDRPEEYQRFDDELDEWEDRVDELSDDEREDFAELTAEVLTEGAQWLTDLQEMAYPALSEEVQAVHTAAEAIDPETNIDQQAEQVEQYFVSSLTAIEEMYIAHEEDPLADTSTHELTPVLVTDGYFAQAEHEDDPAVEDPAIEDPDDPAVDEPEMAEAVQNYIDHIEELDEAELEGEEGHRNVVTAFNHLEEALGTYVEEEEPMLEPAEYDGMEDDPAVEEPADELTEMHEELRNNIDQLEEQVGMDEEFAEHLKQTADSSVELLTSIQTDQFPELADEVEEVREAADEIEADVMLDEQTGEVMSFFEANKDALETMEEEPEPVTLWL